MTARQVTLAASTLAALERPTVPVQPFEVQHRLGYCPMPPLVHPQHAVHALHRTTGTDGVSQHRGHSPIRLLPVRCQLPTVLRLLPTAPTGIPQLSQHPLRFLLGVENIQAHLQRGPVACVLPLFLRIHQPSLATVAAKRCCPCSGNSVAPSSRFFSAAVSAACCRSCSWSSSSCRTWTHRPAPCACLPSRSVL